MRTLDYTITQLDRLQDRWALPIRIFAQYWDLEEHYVVLVDCDDPTYLMLCLI